MISTKALNEVSVSAEQAALKAEEYQREIERQDRSGMWKHFPERHDRFWRKCNWELFELMDFWERKAFNERCWTKKDALLAIKKYLRELERRGRPRRFEYFEERFHFCNLSREDLHERINLLEILEIEQETKQPVFPSAKVRTSHSDRCDSEMQEELDDFRRKHGLTTKDKAEYTPEQLERIRQIQNYWEAQKDDGPPEGWTIEEREYAI